MDDKLKVIFDGIKRISKNQAVIFDEIKKQSEENKKLREDVENLEKKLKTLVNMAGSVQGVVSTDIASCRSDIQKILQKL